MNNQSYRNTLSFKFTTYFVLMCILLCLITIVASRVLIFSEVKTRYMRRHLIEVEHFKRYLDEIVGDIEVAAGALANLYENTTNTQEYKNLLKPILNSKLLPMYVESGGIWHHDKESSNNISWSREKNDSISVDLNLNSKDYINDEWFAPNQFNNNKNCYWSAVHKSVKTSNNIITCSFPIKHNGITQASASLNINIEKFQDFLKSSKTVLDGYTLIVDRNNSIITFPANMLNLDKKYISLEEIKDNFKDFELIYSNLSNINNDKINLAKNINLNDFDQIVKKITSPKISLKDAYLIATNIIINERDKDKIAEPITFETLSESLLKQTSYVTIVEMPRTMWKFVMVTPLKAIEGYSDTMAWRLGLTLLTVIIIIFTGFFIKVRRYLIDPISDIISKLKSNHLNNEVCYLSEERNDELGQIAYWYNRRTKELIEAKKESDYQNNTKRDFLANTSHELRTPLNSIIGMTDLLIVGSKDQDTIKGLNIILESSQSLLEIVNDILDISKIESGSVILERVAFYLNSNLNKVIIPLIPLADRKGLMVKQNMQIPYNMVVWGDPLRLNRIFMNLAANAIKYTENGTIKFSLKTSVDGNKVLLTIIVEDTGIGMTEEQKGRIFSKFAQADNSITRKYGGTGLGLAITKQLIEMMNGTIKVESMYGVGSKFIVNIPLDIADEKSVTDKDLQRDVIPTGTLDSKTVKILIAEDHALNQVFVKKLMDILEIPNIHIVDNGKEVVKAFNEGNFDIIIIDGHMPEMSGYDAIKLIREIEEKNKTPRIPIVAMTANAMMGERERFITLGADEYISKPVDRKTFIKIMSRWIKFGNLSSNPHNTSQNVVESLDKNLPVLETSVLDSFFADKSNHSAEVKELVDIFNEQTQLHLQKLSTLLIDGESKEWREISHLVKGGAAIIGARKLAGIAAISQKMENSNKIDRENVFKELQDAYKEVSLELNNLTNSKQEGTE